MTLQLLRQQRHIVRNRTAVLFSCKKCTRGQVFLSQGSVYENQYLPICLQCGAEHGDDGELLENPEPVKPTSGARRHLKVDGRLAKEGY